jgi:hypothetical protein
MSARISAIADYASFQEKFHLRFADQHYRAQQWLVRVSGRAFLLTLCLVIAQLVISRLRPSDHHLAVTLMMVTLACGNGAFVVSLLAHQLGFEAIAERSTNAAEHFRALCDSISRDAHRADAMQAYAWADECSQSILAEQHSWYRHIPLIRIDL